MTASPRNIRVTYRNIARHSRKRHRYQSLTSIGFRVGVAVLKTCLDRIIPTGKPKKKDGFSHCYCPSIAGRSFYRAKLLRTGGTSSAAPLSVCVCAREPPQIFSCLQNLGIPVLPLPPHLPFHSLVSAVLACTKNGQPCRICSKEHNKRGNN